MTKMLIDIDEEILAKAAEVLGTKTKKDTVNTALQEAVAGLDRAAALADMHALVAEGGIDMEILSDKRRYRR